MVESQINKQFIIIFRLKVDLLAAEEKLGELEDSLEKANRLVNRLLSMLVTRLKNRLLKQLCGHIGR